jgi:DNA modification methylase
MELYRGDCLEKMKDISSNSIDCVILDLPYGTINCDWDIKIDLEKLWKELLRIGKEKTPYFFFCDFKLGVDIVASNKKMFRQDFVWNKQKISNPLLARIGFARSHENILVFYKRKPVYNIDKYHTKMYIRPEPTKPKDNNCFTKSSGFHGYDYEPRLPLSVLNFSKAKKKKDALHSTEKPIELLEYIIKYYTNEGDKVLDPTMGSGSTGIACKNLNRYFIGIELNDDIFATANKRLIN